jgi:hypothetical protein
MSQPKTADAPNLTLEDRRLIYPPQGSHVVICPDAGVEQFVNDHFQTGDFTGWTPINMSINFSGICGTAYGCTGAAFIGNYDAAQDNVNSASLQQILASPVDASCLIVSSIFQITVADCGDPCIDPSTQKARILYTDSTYTEVTLNIGHNFANWTTFNLKPFVQSGKVIKGILWLGTTDYLTPLCVLHVGQVTLKI